MPNIVEVTYAQTGQSTSTNKYGMRDMQDRAFEARNAQYLLLKAPPTAEKSAPSIQATNSIIINAGAGAINITPEAFAAAIQSNVIDKKGTAEAALKLIGPARADPGSTVKFDGIEISSDAISEAPSRIELRANERVEEHQSVQLHIRATNLDSKKMGWAGKLGQREERLPIELDPSVAESEIFGRTSVKVDAALVFKEKGKSRELLPARIYVRRVLK